MKRTISLITALLVAVGFVFSPLGVLALADEKGTTEEYNEKYMAFLNQESGVPGYTNAEAINYCIDAWLDVLVENGYYPWNSGCDYYFGGVNAPIWEFGYSSEGQRCIRYVDFTANALCNPPAGSIGPGEPTYTADMIIPIDLGGPV